MTNGHIAEGQRRIHGQPSRMLSAALAAMIAIGVVKVGNSTTDADVETSIATRGDFVDILVLRGELRTVSSRTVSAPIDAGDLQIIKLARSGSLIKRGDPLVEFDAAKMRQAIVEKRAALGQADAQIDAARAEGRLAGEATRTEQLRGHYDVERARLGAATREVVSRYDSARAELSLNSAERFAREVDERLTADGVAAEATVQAFINKRNEAAADLALAEQRLAAMTLRAPADGRFILQRTWRGPSDESEFREGDRAWSGALIGEIPDTSSIYVAARIDEVDRGRLTVGMTASVRPDAVPGLEGPARLTSFSTLSRPDFSSWPPQRVFDVGFTLSGQDPRLKLGMSTSIRVIVDHLDRTLLIPARALFESEGRSQVYIKRPSGFEARTVVVVRRGPEQVALASGIEPGEQVALADPTNRRRLLSVGSAATP